MPFIFVFENWKTRLTPEQRGKADEIKKKYDGKLIQNREELNIFWNDLNDDLIRLTGKGLYKTKCKYGSHTLLQLSGIVNILAAGAATPEERNRWEGIIEEVEKEQSEGFEESMTAQSDSAISLRIETDVTGYGTVDFFPEERETSIENLIKKINSVAREELKKTPLPGGEYNNDAFRRDTLETLVGVTECALSGNIQEEFTKSDDYILVKGNGAYIPGMGKYGVGVKPDSLPYISDYSRFEHLVPLQTLVHKGMRLVNGNIEYRKKGTSATKDDELSIREQILVEGNDALYAYEKIRRNLNDERVKSSFNKEVDGAYKDTIGARGELVRWESIQRARRELIINGWAMPDITSIGKFASLIAIAKTDKQKTDEENEALRNLENKINTVVHSAPGNEERRKELINSLIEEAGKLPESVKKRYTMIPGMVEELRRAAEHKLTVAEKEILANPAELKKIADAHPVKEYTDAEQKKDLKWLEDIEAKDKELNDIFKTDPYAHDKIRELQAMTKDNPGLFPEVVKKVLGQEAWDSFDARPGRTGDEEKAIDILTHKESAHIVSKNHRTLYNLEKAVKERIIEIPKKNASNIGQKEFTSILGRLAYTIPTISTGYDAYKKIGDISVSASIGEETLFDRQNEYIERLNKVLDSPGNLTNAQQRDEIGLCLMEILGPISAEANNHNPDLKGLFNKEKLSPQEKKRIEKQYTMPFGIAGGLISTAYAEKVMPILKLADRALDRAENLMIQDGHIVTAMNIKPIQATIKGALRGTSAMKINAMDPLIKIPDANFDAPVALHIDRDEKNPLIPGQTKHFSVEEIEEKAEAFPIHKAINAEFELKNIWGEYLKERQKGPLSPEKEKEYWDRIDGCYTTIETVINDLIEKQKNDPTFADNNMRNMVGQSTPAASFEDVITADRGMKGDLIHIKGRREAVNNGWPLSELGLYSHLEIVARSIDKGLEKVEAGGDATREYLEHLKEFKAFLNDRVFNKPFEKDPGKRADLYADIVLKIHNISEEQKLLMGSGSLSTEVKDAIDNSLGNLNNVNSTTDEGGMPLEYELKLFEKEVRIENAEKVMRQLDEIKDIADPIVYNEFRRFIKENPAPGQDYMVIDTSFVEKSDIYLNSIMGLGREIEAVKAGRETTLEAKTGISRDNAVNRIWNMLNASDSFFHVDSKQYKAVKEGLKKLHSGTITDADREKLTRDVKTYLTDPKYDRINKHSKNEFDNTRFNVMFTLANELDPVWAKKAFADMNIAGLHGKKSANTSFHNVYEFTNFMHRQMADGGFLSNAGAIGSQHWYLRPDSYGQKGLVEEVLRVRADASISQLDKLVAERDNLSKLSGDAAGMSGDSGYKSTFRDLEAYRQEIVKLSNEGISKDDSYLINNKDRLTPYRDKAVKEIKNYLNDVNNRSNPLYDKAALAYGVMDPKGAHEYIVELNKRKVSGVPELENAMGQAAFSTTEVKIKPVNLVELEKKQGIDLGGHKSLSKKKMESREQLRKENAMTR